MKILNLICVILYKQIIIWIIIMINTKFIGLHLDIVSFIEIRLLLYLYWYNNESKENWISNFPKIQKNFYYYTNYKFF